MFATGIENSIPTIDHGKTRIDEMEVCGHYERWREDFDCVQEIGINFLRYGPPCYKTYLGRAKFEWEFTDLVFAELKRRDITPIVDLCHFGAPDWLGNFQNPDFPRLFAAYAGEFAERYPWVQLYTPINEMFICAVFSAKYGWWNEQQKDDKSFVTAIKHLVMANIMGMIEILKRRHDAIFIQSESSEYYHADSPAAIGRAEVLNQMRFLSLDLNYGRRVDSGMYQYLFDNVRKIRNVGKAYKQLIADWRNVLPAQSVCLIVPIKKIGDYPGSEDDDAAGRGLGGSGTQARKAQV